MTIGRPRIPPEQRRQRMEISVDPDIRHYLRRMPRVSAYIEQLIRDDLARKAQRKRRA